MGDSHCFMGIESRQQYFSWNEAHECLPQLRRDTAIMGVLDGNFTSEVQQKDSKFNSPCTSVAEDILLANACMLGTPAIFCIELSITPACCYADTLQVGIVLVLVQFLKHSLTVIMGDLDTAYQPNLPHAAYLVEGTPN